MKPLKLTTLTFALGLGLISNSFADSNGTRGGGEGAYTKAGFHLRDLVDPSACTWQSGEDILNTMPALQAKLEKIRAVNWYLEMVLRREIRSIDYCWTHAELKRPDTDTYSQILYYEKIKTVPIAIRLFETKAVYAQADRFLTLGEENGPGEQALLVIHEAMHSLIPLHVSDRYSKIFSIIQAINNLAGDPAEATSFAVSVRRNELTVPSSTEYLADQKFFAYLYGSYQDRKTAILNKTITLSDLLRPREFAYRNQLPLVDQDILQSIGMTPADTLLSQFCITNDQEVITKLSAEKYRDFNINIYCLGAPGAMDRLMDNPSSFTQVAVVQFIQNFYSGLAGIKAWIPTSGNADGRVVLSKEIDWLTSNPAPKPSYRFALEIRPAFQTDTVENAQLHLLEYKRLLTAAATIKEPAEWLEFVKQDSAFVKAFNYNALKTQLSTMHSPIPDEAPACVKGVEVVYSSALNGIVRALKASDLDEHAKLLVDLVNQSKLGFTIEE